MLNETISINSNCSYIQFESTNSCKYLFRSKPEDSGWPKKFNLYIASEFPIKTIDKKYIWLVSFSFGMFITFNKLIKDFQKNS